MKKLILIISIFLVNVTAAFAQFGPPMGPMADLVEITGTAEVGELLTGSYDYVDPNDMPEDGSTYQWYRLDSEFDPPVLIDGATSETYTLVEADSGKLIVFEVTPSNGTETGMPTPSNSAGPVGVSSGGGGEGGGGNNPPNVSNVAISGTLEVGSVLTGSYDYSDSDVDPESGSLYTWYRSNDEFGGGRTPIGGADFETYTLVSADLGKYMSFSVIPSDGIDAGTSGESSLEGPVLAESPSITFAGGSGIEADPYQIATLEQLQAMKDSPSSYYILNNDIDASATSTWNSDAGFVPIGGDSPFTGNFDGQGFVITGLTIDRPTEDYIGLFAVIGNGGSVSNIGLEQLSITGSTNTGGLAGESNGSISGSYVSGSVEGSTPVGGLVALNNANITSSYSAGTVAGTQDVGGLVGLHSLGTISKSYSTSNVTGSANNVGGLIGFAYDNVENSFATGSASGDTNVGGFAGNYNSGTVNNSFSAGSVTGSTNVGGFIGQKNSFAAANNSFWDTEASGQASATGIGSTTGITGKTTTEMQTQSTYTDAGWDFTDTWVLDASENNGYPVQQDIFGAGAANTSPEVTNAIADFTVSENAQDSLIDLTNVFSDIEENDEDLTYSVVSNSNPTLVSVTPDQSTDLLTLNFQADQTGTADITIRATDSEGLTADDSFTVTVEEVLAVDPATAFITTWETTSPGQTVTIPTNGDGVSDYDFTIDWGDGTVETYSGDEPSVNHTYASAGDYEILIGGTFPHFAGDETDLSGLISIDQWGNIAWESMENMFYQATNLVTYDATDTPGLSASSSLKGMFAFAGLSTADFSGWDVSSITDFSEMFANAVSFNGDLTGWTFSSDPFLEANALNFTATFSGASAFTGTGLDAWNVSNADSMSTMFAEASVFNQDLSSWDISNVKDMFFFALSTSLSTANYTAILSSWSALTVQGNVDFSAGTTTYNLAGLEGRDALTNTFGWNITDGGLTAGALSLSTTEISPVDPTIVDTLWIDLNIDGTVATDALSPTWTLTPEAGMTAIGIPVYDELREQWGYDLSGIAVSELDQEYALEISASISLENGSSSIDDNFSINITVPNSAPIVTQAIEDVTVDEDAADSVFGLTNIFSDVEDNDSDLTYSIISNSNSALLSASVNNTVDSLTFVFVANQYGTAEIVIQAEDSEGLSILDSVTVTVDPVNDVPLFTKGESQVVDENADPQSTSNWASAISAGATNENGQVLTFIVSTDNDDLFEVGPTVDPVTGELTYTPATDSFGVATVTISLSDDGGTSNGGIDTSPDQSFTITVEEVLSLDPLTAFITTWRTTSPNESITLYTTGGADISDFDAYIDWGDGTIEQITGDDPDPSHEYATSGDYEVRVYGVFLHLDNSDNTGLSYGETQSSNAAKLIAINQWGDIAWESMENMFYQTPNLVTYEATDTPDLSLASSLEGMFAFTGLTTSDLSGWDVSTITNFSNMFSNALSFNGDLSDWTFSSDPFSESTALDFTGMFNLATSFTGTGLSNWDVSNAETMTVMFSDAALFNQDLSSWDISNVTDMFLFAEGTALSTANYTAMLSDWGELGLQSGVDFSVGNTPYTIVGQTGRDEISVTYGWNITDGGLTAGALSLSTIETSPIDTSATDTLWMDLTIDGTVATDALNPGWTLTPATGLTAPGTPVYNETRQQWGYDLSGITVGELDQEYALSISASVSLENGTSSVDDNFSINITVPNTAPVVVAAIDDVSVDEDAADTSVDDLTSYFADAEESAGDLVYSVETNSNPTLLTALVNNTTDNLTLSYEANAFGTGDITIRATDSGGLTADTSFTVTVNSVNDVPVFTAGDNQTVDENTGAQTVTDWASAISAGAANESGQVLNFNVSTDNDALFSVLPVIDASTGDLSYTPTADSFGEATVTISLSDDAGTTNGGVDTSADQTFTITVNEVLTVDPTTAFVTTWQTTIPGETVTIPTGGGATISDYDAIIDWGDGNIERFTGDDPNPSHTYATAGDYTISIGGTFPHLSPEADGELDQLITIEQWGNNQWKSMNRAFAWAKNMEYNATDTPDLSSVTDMGAMFFAAVKFNGEIGNWDVSNITSMGFTFDGASIFNGDISTWTVTNVTGMRDMFQNAAAFNQDLSSWDIRNVTNMLNFMDGTALSTVNYNNMLSAWSTLPLTSSVNFSVGTTPYSIAGKMDRDSITDTFGWNITDGGLTAGALSLSTIETSPIDTSATDTLWMDLTIDGTVATDALNPGWTLTPATGLTAPGTPVYNETREQWALDLSDITVVEYDREYTFDVSASVPLENGTSSIEDNFSINITVPNTAPVVITAIEDVTVDEDADNTTIDLTSYFSDAEQPVGDLVYSVETNTNSTLVTASVNNATDILTLAYGTNEFGTADITIRATDSGGLTVDNSFSITVNAVNDAPTVVNPIADISIDEDGTIDPIDLTTVFSDAEDAGNELTYFAESSNVELFNTSINTETNELSFTVTPDTYGTAEFIVVAQDTDQLFALDTVSVTVNPATLQVTLLSDRSDTLSVYPGFTDTLRFTAQDANTNPIVSDDDLTWTITNDYGLTMADPVYDATNENWTITFKSDDNESAIGTLSIEVQYTDYNNLGQVQSVVLDPRGNRPFITSWDVSGSNMSITFMTADEVDGKDLSLYDFRIDWGNGEIEFFNGDAPTVTKTYATEGDRTIIISGDFPHLAGLFHLQNSKSRNMKTVSQWGDIEWESMAYSFAATQNLALTAEDVPDLSRVTSMERMFALSKISTPNLSGWDVSGVTNMNAMFLFAPDFNSDISAWDVGNVQNMNAMFVNASSFNQDIGNWNVASVDSMVGMFANAAAFDQNLAEWDISQVVSFDDETQGAAFMNGTALSTSNYDSLLTGWGAQTVQPDLTISFGETQYSLDGESGRQQLLNAGWTINDGGLTGNPFITTWRTTSTNETITIPTGGGTDIADYDFQISWGDGTVDMVSGDDPDPTHTYTEPGDYEVVIVASTFYLRPNQDGDLNQLISLDQWGDIEWQSMNNSFAWVRNMEYNATDVPDLSNVETMAGMFFAAEKLNGDFSSWNTSVVTDMSFMFDGATMFNGDISTWDVSKVTNMREIFQNADSFNQDLSNWNVSSVTNMQGMFQDTDSFNGDVSTWNTGAATNMFGMFANAVSFNQSVSGWDVSKVTDFGGMFLNSTSFNQDISDWDITSATRFDNGNFGFLQGTSFSQQNYDLLLHNWNKLEGLPENLSLNVGSAKYGPSSAARDNLTGFKSWTLTDGGRYNMFISTWEVTSEQPTIQLGAKGGDQISDFDFTIDWGDGMVERFVGDNPTITHTYTSFGTKSIRIAGIFPGMNSTADGVDVSLIKNVVLWGEIVWEDMTSMFAGADDLTITAQDSPDLSKVSSMEGMFASLSGNSTFNADISDWDVSNVSNFKQMFGGAVSFNQDISSWNVSSATTMESMFSFATSFDQNLGNWDITNVQTFDGETDGLGFMDGTAISTVNFDSTLIGWAQKVTTNSSTEVSFGEAKRSLRSSESYEALTNLGWIINSGGTTNFVTRWVTTSADETITIPTGGGTELSDFDFSIDWGDGSPIETITGDDPDPTHNYASADTHTVMISGIFPHMSNNEPGDLNQLVSIENWGDIKWESMERMFATASNLSYNASDVPDLSSLTNMSSMFLGASTFNGDISDWDVSKVTDMSGMFHNASSFDQDLGDWQITSVESLQLNELGFLEGTALSIENYDLLLTKWSVQNNLPNGLTLGVGETKYSPSSLDDRSNLIDNSKWVINDGGIDFPLITLEANKTRMSVDSTLSISLKGNNEMLTGQKYQITWSSSNSDDQSQLDGFSNPVFNSETNSWVLNLDPIKLAYPTGVNFNVNVSIPIEESDSTVALQTGSIELFTNFRLHENGVTIKGEAAAVDESGYVIVGETPAKEIWIVTKVSNEALLDRANIDFTRTVTTGITDMRGLFDLFGTFNDDISHWDVSDVIDMSFMFSRAKNFNQPLEHWDVSNVKDMNGMFFRAATFSQPIGDWDVSSVTDMSDMFNSAEAFDQPIGNWDVSSVTDMSDMFIGAEAFDQPIGNWDVSSVTGMSSMFLAANSFNQPIGNWNVSSVKNMSSMFSSANSFNQPIGDWDVSSVIDMNVMFFRADTFNQPIGDWDVSSVKNMSSMFRLSNSFNQPIGNWDVSNVLDLGAMFLRARVFNQNLNNWDISHGPNTSSMFLFAFSFNNGNAPGQKTKLVKGKEVLTSLDWDVSNVTNMASMFQGAKAFNQDISSWDVSNVQYFDTAPVESTDTAAKETATPDSSANNKSERLANGSDRYGVEKEKLDAEEERMVNSQNGSESVEGKMMATELDSIAGFLVGSGMTSATASKMFVEWSKRDLQDGVSINIGNIELNNEGATAMKALRAANNMVVAWGGEEGVIDEPVFTGLPTPYEVQTEDTRILKLWDYVSDVATPDNELEFKFSIDSDSAQTIGFDTTSGELAITAPAYADTFFVAIQVANNENIVSLDTLEVRTSPLFTSAEEMYVELPATAELKQNYPNPFNPSTIIRYGVPQSGEVRLDVFDLLGRRVATLIDNERKSAGWHQVNFDASHLASGIYLYRIVAGKYVKTHRMTLIK